MRLLQRGVLPIISKRDHKHFNTLWGKIGVWKLDELLRLAKKQGYYLEFDSIILNPRASEMLDFTLKKSNVVQVTGR